MKKIRNLLIVTTLLMVLSFTLPVGRTGANDEGITTCCDGPPVDSIGLC